METSTTPKYRLVAEHIRSQIRTGRFRLGEILPGERVLAAELEVSRPTVRRAVEALESEGILECNPSIGSVVRRAVRDRLLVGYLVPDLQDPFHLELVRELDILLQQHGGALLVQQGSDDTRLVDTGLTHLVKHHKLYSAEHPDRVPTIYTGDVPARAHMIISDVRSGIAQIYRHLRQLGHVNIGYASPFAREEDEQHRCLLEFLSRDGLPAPDEWHFQVDPHDRKRCEETLTVIRDDRDGPSALVCYNDWLAIAFIKAARELGIEIPGDLSITGYDDLYVSSLLQVPLTTVRFSRKESARRIIDLLLRGRFQEPETILMETRLIVRESTHGVKH
jgi:DNA-binding LacI/PurR family transcriptional regulator